MDLLDLTLLGPVNDVLALRGLPELGLQHLAGAQLALVAADRAVAAVVPSRRRRRRRGGGGILGLLALLCCLVPLVVVAGVGYLLWRRSQASRRGPEGGGHGVPPAPGAPPPPGAPPASGPPAPGPDDGPGPPSPPPPPKGLS